MFYISSKKDDRLLGVMDSSDGVEEFYTVEELNNIIKTSKVDIWGYIECGAYTFEESFVVDIDRFLHIIKSCYLLYRTTISKEVVTYSLSRYEAVYGSRVTSSYMKAFNSDMCFNDALKYITLYGGLDNDPNIKFLGIRYRGIPGLQFVDVLRDSIVVKYLSGKTFKLFDLEHCFSKRKPYIEEILITLESSNLDMGFHNSPYGEAC